MFKRKVTELEKRLWERLSSEAGIAYDRYQRVSRWAHSDTRRYSLVSLYRNEAGHGVVLKAALQDIDAHQFAGLVETQEKANSVFGQGPFRTPRVLAADIENKAFLMEEARGEQLFDLIEESTHHEPFLEKAGAWVSAFHREGFAEERQFKPGFNRRRIRDLRHEVETSATTVCERGEFLQASEKVLGFLDAFESGVTKASWQHGDMNLHNFIVDGDALWGIDFTKVDVVPIGYDVARFLLHYSALLADHRKLEPGLPAPRSSIDAFFRGYDFAPFEDPSIQVILRVRILNDWMRYPDSYLKMKMRQRFRFERYRTILKSLLAIG